jgi:hypothetical protein
MARVLVTSLVATVLLFTTVVQAHDFGSIEGADSSLPELSDDQFSETPAETTPPTVAGGSSETPGPSPAGTESLLRLGHLNDPDNVVFKITRSPNVLLLHIFDKVHLYIYEKHFTEDDITKLPSNVKSIDFLYRLLCDAFNETDKIISYDVKPPDDRSQHFRFTIANSYRYGSFKFAFEVRQKDLDENVKIALRLDKALEENGALKKSMLETQQQNKQLQRQMQEIMVNMRYTRVLERDNRAVSMQVVLRVLTAIHDVPNTKSNWEKTRSFGGLDLDISLGGQYKDGADQVLALAKLCNAPSVTYRRAAHKALEVFEQQNG